MHKTTNRIRVIDVVATATAEEVELILNGPYADGYYLDRLILTGIPEGVGMRAFYRFRVKAERFDP